MTTMRGSTSFALAAALAAVTFACGGREEKKSVAPVEAAEAAQDQEVLDQLRSAGSNVAKPHQIEFYMYLPSQVDAEGAEAELRALGYGVTVRVAPDNIHWLCIASRKMLPTIEGLTDARGVLKGMAMRYRGAYAGWEAAIEH
jgi:regulator of ribonuclease activity B